MKQKQQLELTVQNGCIKSPSNKNRGIILFIKEKERDNVIYIDMDMEKNYTMW